MALKTSIARPAFAWSVDSRPKPGQQACGDLHLVKELENTVLLAVVDGLGHGSEAISAAQRAVEILGHHATDPLITLVHRCHQVLARTRGVVMTLASLNVSEGTLTWLGVGNVEGWLFRFGANARPRSERVLLRSGVVGYNLPALHTAVLPVARGDLLVFATDGIRAGFTDQVKLANSPSDIAQHALAHYFKGTDDALVLAVRYFGKAHE